MGFSKRTLSAVDIIKDEIIDSDQSWFVARKPQQNLNIYELGIALFLEKGVISLYNKKNNSLIFDIQAPAIIGLLSLTYDDEVYYVLTKTDCDLHSIKIDHLKDILNKKKLWVHIFDILAIYMSEYTRIELIFRKKTAREIVIGCIKYIESLPPDIQLKTSIYEFILSRCTISRSSIYNELKSLKKLGMITIKQGVVHASNIETNKPS